MNILTFDVEEWFHLLDHSSTRYEDQWNSYETRIHRNMERIFHILEETDTKATFFIVGWIAKKYPEIVKEISRNYEIGSHTMNHQLVWQQSPQDFKEDVEYSIKLLEDISGKKIKYFRAPGFSIRSSEMWAFEILYQNGIEIDCSVFPAYHSHGGMPEYGNGLPKLIKGENFHIKELPISYRKLLGKNIVYQGGGYFRLFPYFLIKKWAKKDSVYLQSYIHPRDLDATQPVISDLSMTRKFKSYVGLSRSEKKLTNLLSDFKFIDINEANKMIDWSAVEIIRV